MMESNKSTPPMCWLYTDTTLGQSISMNFFSDTDHLFALPKGRTPTNVDNKLTALLSNHLTADNVTPSTIVVNSVDAPRPFSSNPCRMGRNGFAVVRAVYWGAQFLHTECPDSLEMP